MLNIYERKRNSTNKIAPTTTPQSPLAAQRLRRPISPHMTIYKWNYVSSASALQRISGILLSGSLYACFTFYLAAPAMGIHFDSTSITTAFGSLPIIAKAVMKFVFSMPFTWHGFNGVKHLIWDTGRCLTRHSSGRMTWLVLACSTSASLALTWISL